MQNILVVEDDTIFARILAKSLKARGFDVEIACDKEAAEELMRALLPDAVILDLNLNGQNGLDLLPIIQDIQPDTRVILLTSYAHPRAAVWAIQNGASDYLTKPIEIDEIVFALTRCREDKHTAPESYMSPDEVRDIHILQFFEKNDCNVSRTARDLKMHRRTLQRILERLRPVLGPQDDSQFGRARRLFNLWTRSLLRSQGSDELPEVAAGRARDWETNIKIRESAEG